MGKCFPVFKCFSKVLFSVIFTTFLMSDEKKKQLFQRNSHENIFFCMAGEWFA